jgi:hypothetical protein
MHGWFRFFLRHVSAVLILNPATEKRPFGRAYIIHIGVWIGRSSDVFADKLKTRIINKHSTDIAVLLGVKLHNIRAFI